MKKTSRSLPLSLKVLFFVAVIIVCGVFFGEQANVGRLNNARSEEIPTIKKNGSVQYSSSAQGSFAQWNFAPANSSDSVSVIMVGDILLHDRVLENCLTDDGTYSFSSIFAGTKSVVASADIALVNQEVIIGGAELGLSGYPRFNAPYEIADALVDAGFNVICHATNHALDKGKDGILNCLTYWETHHPDVSVIGLYKTKEQSEKTYVYEQNGMKIAVLNYTLHTNWLPPPKDMKYAVNLLDEDKVRSDLEKAQTLADFIIVCPHWGVEYSHEVTAAQREWCKIFMEYGVGLVLGTHPHVIQPIEMITDEATGKQMLVYFSLGNFVNWTSNTGKNCASQFVGGMADVRLEKAADGSVFIADYTVRPTVCHITEQKNRITVYFLSAYSKAKATANAIKKQDSSFSYEYCTALVKRIWPQFAE